VVAKVIRRALTAALAAALLLTACDSGDDDGGASTTSDTTVSGDPALERENEFLLSAAEGFDIGNPVSVIAQTELAARDESVAFDPVMVLPDAFADIFAAMEGFEDTTDFDVLYLLNLWYGYGDRLSAETRAAIKEHLLRFKYWYTEPTPADVVDNKYYWSENHRIIFHVDEYLAGLAFPDDTFTNDGRSGAEHAETAERRIREWLEEKVRFGWSEWHSDVYYQKDATPLLTLVEFSPDDDLANRAAMVLDLLLLDIALHLQRGTFGATHGRSYMKDKSTAVDEDTFALSKILFGDSTEPFAPSADAGGTLFARAKQYVVPDVIRHIAVSDETTVDQEHMNVPLDVLAPVTDSPEAPYGMAFDDPANVPFWWERGAQTAWQVVPLTLRTLDEHGLWESQFFKPFQPLRDLVGDDVGAAQRFAQQLAPLLGFGLLTEVHTYTYRAPDVMLSTAQDYRPGVFGEQYHAWQATLDEHALVFTTHPKNEPQEGTQWPDDDGYWTGTGSMPRSAQHGTVGIHIYAPQFAPAGPPLDQFTYLPYTHAYFPRERFDEVVTDGNWTLGRKGDGYIALWSFRPTRWREHDPAKVFTHGLTEPFDLVADGGTETQAEPTGGEAEPESTSRGDNTWIVEAGDAATWRTFDAFRDAITAAEVRAVPRAPRADGLPGGFDVTYGSPSQGPMTFGWDAPLTVKGDDVDLHPDARMDNPYVTVPFEGRLYEISAEGASLRLDFDSWTRSIG
jgi:hypothetical protein